METTVYLQLRGQRLGWADSKGKYRVTSVSLVRATSKRPRRPLGGTVLVKLSLEVPAAAFEAFEPEATVVIPEGHALPTLTVEAQDPRTNDGEG